MTSRASWGPAVTRTSSPQQSRADDVAVDDDLGLLQRRHVARADHVVRAQDHRPEPERVRGDEVEHEHAGVPLHDRAVAREVVGRGAGRRGDDEAVAEHLPTVTPATSYSSCSTWRGATRLRTTSLTALWCSPSSGDVDGEQVDDAGSRRPGSCSRPSCQPSRGSAARKPTLPKLTPSVGTPLPSRRPRARRMVPSPPNTRHRSAVRTLGLVDRAVAELGRVRCLAASSAGMRSSRPRRSAAAASSASAAAVAAVKRCVRTATRRRGSVMSRLHGRARQVACRPRRRRGLMSRRRRG